MGAIKNKEPNMNALPVFEQVTPELPFQYFRSLDDSLIYCLRRNSKHHELNKVVDVIFESLPDDVKNCRQKLEKKRKDAIHNIVSNIIIAHRRGKVIAVSLNRNTYSVYNRRYKITFAFEITGMIHEMKDAGWIHQHIFFYFGAGDRRNHKSRIWMSEKLRNIIPDDILAEDIYQDLKEPIILKDSQKNEIAYKDTRFSIKRRKFINKYNSFMKNFEIQYTPTPREQTIINPHYEKYHLFKQYISNFSYLIYKHKVNTQRMTANILSDLEPNTPPPPREILILNRGKSLLASDLRCIFNRGDKKGGKAFNFGGRFYTGDRGHQSIRKGERKTITINGEKTVERDFDAFHIAMLYAKMGIQIQGSPYIIDGMSELKDLVKSVFLVSLNAKSERETLGSIGGKIFLILMKKNIKQSELKMLNGILHHKPDFKELILTIETVHAPIAKFINDDAGITLMNDDSKIMTRILDSLIERNIPCLPVHDSVIVMERHDAILRQTMDKAYRKEMNGFTCALK